MDDFLADKPLSNEAAARLNVVREQLEGKIKVLINLNSEIVGVCQVDNITCKIDKSEGLIAKLIKYKQKIASARSSPASHLTESLDSPTVTVGPAVKP